MPIKCVFGCQTDAFGKKRAKNQKLWEKYGCHTDAPWVPIRCAMGAIRVRFGKNQKIMSEYFEKWVPIKCAFRCQSDAPKNGEGTTPHHKKEFSTGPTYLKIKYIKKETDNRKLKTLKIEHFLQKR